jgi:hypothetical protein
VLREVLPEIETALRAGVSRVAILEELRGLGLEMTESGFRSALRRLRLQRSWPGRVEGLSASPTFWPATGAARPTFATTARGSLYDIDALSRLFLASRGPDRDDPGL